MPTLENPNAGQVPVVLDIGALIVTMAAAVAGLEVEFIPTGTDTCPADPDQQHDRDGDHDGHRHPHTHLGAPPQVAVVARTTPGGSAIHSPVLGQLAEGTPDPYVRPDGSVTLTADILGG